ncbi:Type IV leader peptidase family protein [compost metagenome]
MPIAEIVQYVIGAAFCAVAAWIAISDIRHRRIPNLALLVLLALFLPWCFLAGGVHFGPAIVAAAIALVVTMALWLTKIIGAGDSKMFATVALFMGLDNLPAMALLTVLIGGVMALASFASRPRRALAMITLRGKGDWGRGIPYGVAIALAGAIGIWSSLLGLTPQIAWRHDVTVEDMQALIDDGRTP